MDGSQLAGMSPEQRIAAVQANSLTTQDIAHQNAEANVSHYGSIAAGAALASRGGWVGLAAYGAAIGGAVVGNKLAEVIHADQYTADAMQALGMHRIASGGPKAARQGDQIAHSFAAFGFLASALLGVAAALAAAALIVATGGVAAVAIIGAAAAGGFTAGFLGGALSGALSQMGMETGPITSGSSNVLINGKPAIRMTDLAACSWDGPTPLLEGCKNVFVNSLPMVRVGHKLACGATVDQGSTNVLLNNTVVACGVPASDVPLWLKVTCDWAMFLIGGKKAADVAEEPVPSEEITGENPTSEKPCEIDPVDVATGEFVEWRTDIEIGGVLPIRLKRTYASNRGNPVGSLFGPRWNDSFNVCLVHGKGTLTYWDEEGVGLVFDTPRQQLNAVHLAAPDLLLQGSRDAPVLTSRSNGTSIHFVWHGEVARPSEVKDAYNNSYRFVYDKQRLQSIEHSNGYRLTFHRRDGVANASNGTQNALSIVVQEMGHLPVEVVRYGFDQCGRLINSQSEFSGKLYYRYDDNNRITNWGDASYTHVTLRYRSDGRVAEVITPGGIHSGHFEYDTVQRRTTLWVDGEATIFDYSEDNLVTSSINPLGQTTLTTWDKCRRKVSETDRLGQATRYDYDAAGRLSAITDSRLRKTLQQYDTTGRLIALMHADGTKQQWQYDIGGQIIAATGKDGNTLYNSYDAAGRLISSTAADGNVTQYEYDANSNLCAAVIANGSRQEWKRDLLGRTTESTNFDGQVTRCEYAPLAALNGTPFSGPGPIAGAHRSPLEVQLPTSDRIVHEYDREGLVTAITDAAGGKMQYVWGPYDLLMATTDQAGYTIRYEYDSHARLEKVVNAQGDSWCFSYDAGGQLVEETDFNRRTTRYRYDAVGRLQSRTVADWLTTRYVWDELERLAAMETDDRRIVYQYDEKDRLVCAKRLDGDKIESEILWSYDEIGRTSKTIQDGNEISWEFDAFGRNTARHTPVGSSTQQHDMFGLLQSLHTPCGEVFIARDQMGREIGRSSILSSDMPQLPLQSIAIPNIASQSHFQLQQRYDAVGRLLEQQVGAASGVTPLFGDAHTMLRRYHWQRGNLVCIDDPRFGNVRYANDKRGQIVRTDYEVRPAYRGAESRITQESFAYDQLGNIASRDIAVPDQLDAPQRVEAQSYTDGKVSRCGNVGYRYDLAGRMVERTVQRNGFRPQTWEFRWDGFDRMVGVRTPQGEVWHYTYDAMGRRTSKERVSAIAQINKRPQIQRESYLWDGATLAVQWKVYADGTSEVGGQRGSHSETLAWHHHPGTFTPLAVCYQRDGGESELLHIVTDHLGTPREAIRNSGEVVWAAQLQTWGGVNQKWSPHKTSPIDLGVYTTATAVNDEQYDIDLRLANQWEDSETGLFYNFQRYYDPLAGQYVSSDPIGFDGGLRSHGYVPNPSIWIDPLGLVGCAHVDSNGVLNLRNKYSQNSAEDLALQKHVDDWNTQVQANGGSMTRQAVTPAMRAQADQAARAAKTANPAQYPVGMAPGHTPDVGWGGATAGPIIPLNSTVNSYVGGATQAVPVGTTYNSVQLYR